MPLLLFFCFLLCEQLDKFAAWTCLCYLKSCNNNNKNSPMELLLLPANNMHTLSERIYLCLNVYPFRRMDLKICTSSLCRHLHVTLSSRTNSCMDMIAVCLQLYNTLKARVPGLQAVIIKSLRYSCLLLFSVVSYSGTVVFCFFCVYNPYFTQGHFSFASSVSGNGVSLR